MNNSIPKKILVALPDFNNPKTGSHKIVPPEEAMIPAFDRSYHFGDSLYEVVRTYDGILFDFDGHMKRLFTSAKLSLYNEMPNPDQIKSVFEKISKRYFELYGNTDLYIRLTVSRGLGDLNIDPTYSSEPYFTVFAKAVDVPTRKLRDEGLSYQIVDRHRNLVTALSPAIKSGNYLNNVLAIAEAKLAGASDAILPNYQGFITEGTTNNVYMVKDNSVWTAPLDLGILAGITRDWVFELCKKNNIDIQERLFTTQEMLTADEAFMSSSTKEVIAITKLNGIKVNNGNPGPVTKKIELLFTKAVEDFITSNKSKSMYV